jgi:hypothetical protein
MPNLRKLARGQDCLIRVPTVCNGNPDTVVLCHIRMIDLSGTGIKAPDVFATFGCSACHAVCDGQQKSEFSYSERRLLLLEGMLRYQLWLMEQGILTHGPDKKRTPKLSKIVPRRAHG